VSAALPPVGAASAGADRPRNAADRPAAIAVVMVRFFMFLLFPSGSEPWSVSRGFDVLGGADLDDLIL
jgi:hypothetical protein